MEHNKLTLRGTLTLDVLNRRGVVEQSITIDNMIMQRTLEKLMAALSGTPTGIDITHLAVGTGRTPQTAVDTTLETEKFRLAAVRTNPDPLSVEVKASWGIGAATGVWSEAGLFDSASGGEMWARTTFPDVEVKAENQLIATWTITISSQEA